jgi:hypothetical protein
VALSPDERKALANLRKAKLPPFEADIVHYVRLIRTHHKDGLGFSKLARSRFSDSGRPPSFGIVYAAQDLATAVAEAIIRDRRDGAAGPTILSHGEAVSGWRAVYFSSKEPLRLLNLTGAGTIAFGIPTDIVRSRNQAKSRQLSRAIHRNPSGIDGILYASRLTTGQCLALYDRALAKLTIEQEMPLTALTHDLAAIYGAMNVRIAKP